MFIYLITNTRTGKVYVGKTKNTGNRWAVHRSELRLGKHSNPDLQLDYSADPNVWHYQIIESIEGECALGAEREWINAFPEVYNQLGRNDYVFTNRCGGWPLGRTRTTSHSQKISAALRKPCTVDGKTIYPSAGALKAALGQGKSGSRSPMFRYV
jgi:hypothetical protein